MSYQVPSDVIPSIDAFIGTGGYSSSDDVLRAAVGLLKRQESDIAAIQEGIADEAAGRVTPARDVLARYAGRVQHRS
jgi:Arc/MetJ-type ribon-helix-helix transcriptional regulator